MTTPLRPTRAPLSIRTRSTPAFSGITHLALRINPRNPNHHLWNNHGTWFIHYSIHRGPCQERIRASLGTKELATARERRDAAFAHLQRQAEAGSPMARPERPALITEGRAA